MIAATVGPYLSFRWFFGEVGRFSVVKPGMGMAIGRHSGKEAIETICELPIASQRAFGHGRRVMRRQNAT